LKLLKVYHALILSNALIVKVTTWLMTTNVLSGETALIGTGTQRKLKKPGKPGPIQFA